MQFPIKYRPACDPHFLNALDILPIGPDASPGELWQAAHFKAQTAANYCSEKRIHPAMVCAWLGALQPSDSYSEATMLGAMALVSTIKKLEALS